jgi:NitT/TauT family transport system permease protein
VKATLRLHHPYRLGWRDLFALALVLGAMILVGLGAREMVGPLIAAPQPKISLSPAVLPGYALRTTLRMFAALAASLLFTFTYATAAAKSRRAEMVLIPLLDVMQSVPILGYLSFTVLFFVSLFPGNILGAELAAIFAIFTSQAWNMAFSFYQSLITVPRDLDETSRCFRFTAWQRFWRLEVPFAMPGLIWNTMMSMSGGWFFVVASEAISVGNVQISLPGVGSYVARAIQERDLGAVGWAILTMAVVIVLYDQLLFRPLVAWSDKFRAEETAAQIVPHSWVLDLVSRSPLAAALAAPIASGAERVACARMAPPSRVRPWHLPAPPKTLVDVIWYGAIAAFVVFAVWKLVHFAQGKISWHDVQQVAGNGALTLGRVVTLVVLASLIWVPISVWIGLQPKIAERVQATAQFLAAFPANLLFPIFVVGIVHFHLNPAIWLVPLMILGTQWYIVFNVIAGATAFPTDFREVAGIFHIRGWRWWRDVILPGVFPYYVTGAITASGGAWNASIVSEWVSWGSTKLSAGGLGAYIAQATEAGDFSRIALGVAMMSFLVVSANRLVWRPLYAFAERRTRLD